MDDGAIELFRKPIMKYQYFCSGGVNFTLPIRYPNREIAWSFTCIDLKFRGKVLARNIDMKAINI